METCWLSADDAGGQAHGFFERRVAHVETRCAHLHLESKFRFEAEMISASMQLEGRGPRGHFLGTRVNALEKVGIPKPV